MKNVGKWTAWLCVFVLAVSMLGCSGGGDSSKAQESSKAANVSKAENSAEESQAATRRETVGSGRPQRRSALHTSMINWFLPRILTSIGVMIMSARRSLRIRELMWSFSSRRIIPTASFRC